MKKKIAITGGIGSGKSEVVKAIKELNYPVFSCDEINAELLKRRTVLKRIKVLFPNTVRGFFKPKLDKKALSNVVFSDKSAVKILNSILHPLIMNTLNAKMKRANSELVFAEVPLLFEADYKELFDEIIVVVRDKEQRIKSVMVRSNLTESDVLKRMNNQVNYDAMDLSDYLVIENNSDVENLKEKTKKIIEQKFIGD